MGLSVPAKWRDRGDVKRPAVSHGSGHFYMLPLVAGDSVRVVDRHYLLVFVGHEHRLLAAFDTFLGSLRVRRVRAFGGTLGVADPSIPTAVFRTCYGPGREQRRGTRAYERE